MISLAGDPQGEEDIHRYPQLFRKGEGLHQLLVGVKKSLVSVSHPFISGLGRERDNRTVTDKGLGKGLQE